MQTLEVTFQKNFHTSNEDRFLMETLIIKVNADTVGEDAQYLWDKAREEAELNHKRNNPHLFPPDIPIIPKVEKSNQMITREELERQLMYGKNIPEQIQSCTELKTLESYKFIVRGKPDLQTIYDNKLKSLQ